MKLVIWVLIAFVILYLVRSKKKPAAKPPPAGPTGATKPMLRCAQCGVYLPASESLVDPAGAVFCSEEHRVRHASH